jgi:hypothetical protein
LYSYNHQVWQNTSGAIDYSPFEINKILEGNTLGQLLAFNVEFTDKRFLIEKADKIQKLIKALIGNSSDPEIITLKNSIDTLTSKTNTLKTENSQNQTKIEAIESSTSSLSNRYIFCFENNSCRIVYELE